MKKPPNILWICTDQQRSDTLGCYGNTWVTTPHIDRLATGGALFENCFVQSPVCSPSRASFMTGRYPRTTRLRQNGQILPADEKLISRLFADAGYVAGLVGKFHMGPGAPSVALTTEPRVNDGFVEFNWAQSPNDIWGMHSDYTRFLRERGLHFQTAPHPMSRWVRHGMPEQASEAAWCATRTVEFITRYANRDAPWFFMANIYAPHHPFDPPESCLAPYLDRLSGMPLPVAMDDDLLHKPRYQRIDSEGAYGNSTNPVIGGFGRSEMTDMDHRIVRAAYFAMCDHVDQQVGKMLRALDEHGEAENTIVVYSSDHGEMLGDHNIYLKGPYFYDAAIKIPLIVRYPGHITAARHAGLFEMVNVAPTLLEAAGLSPQPGMQGRSAMPWLKAPELAPEDGSIYCEYYNAMPYHLNPSAQLTMLRTATHKLVVDHTYGDGELYDLQQDPLERNNLWNEVSVCSAKIDLLTLLTHRMAFTADPLPPRLAEW